MCSKISINDSYIKSYPRVAKKFQREMTKKFELLKDFKIYLHLLNVTLKILKELQ